MNILVTGITGFIGENISKKLFEEGHKIYSIIRKQSNIKFLSKEFNLIVFDENVETLSEYMLQNKIHIVIHVASYFLVDHNAKQVNELVNSNVKFGTQLLEAMSLSDVKYFINTASTWQNFDPVSFDYHPTNLYAATKQAFETILEYYCDVCQIKAITLTIFDSYGPNDRRGKLVSLLGQFAENQTELNMSEGMQEIGLTYIDDITNAYMQAIEEVQLVEGHKKYALSPLRIYTLREVVELFEKQTGTKLNINWGAKPYRKREVMNVWRKGDILPNWKPTVDLADGLVKMFNTCR